MLSVSWAPLKDETILSVNKDDCYYMHYIQCMTRCPKCKTNIQDAQAHLSNLSLTSEH